MARNYHIFDLVIIGAGTAGIAALQEALKHTINVALVEQGEGGTTCAVSGCMPSKALIHAARLQASARHFSEAGIDGAEKLRPDIRRVLNEVRRKRNHFVEGVYRSLEPIRHYIVRGRARFESPTLLRVDDKLFHTRSVIIATGSRPVVPESFAALPEEQVLTSDTLFTREDLPRRIGVVGLGAIGVEMAQALAFLGHEVIGIHSHEHIGGIQNPAIATAIRQMLATDMELQLGVRATAQSQNGEVQLEAGDKTYSVDAVLVSAGRRPVVDGLELSKLKLPMQKNGLPEYNPDSLQLGDIPVFVAGDVNGARPLQHEAALDGKLAAQHALRLVQGKAFTAPLYSHYPAMQIMFTEPTIATIGMDWATAHVHNAVVGEVSFETQGRAVLEQRNQGLLQIFLHPENGQLLGAEMLAPGGEHLAHLLALAVQQRMTAQDLLTMPFYHPTLEEGLRTALVRGIRQIKP